MDPIEIMQKVLRILFYVLVIGALVGFAQDHWFGNPNTGSVTQTPIGFGAD